MELEMVFEATDPKYQQQLSLVQDKHKEISELIKAEMEALKIN